MRKGRGAFFTPPQLAEMVCDALIRRADAKVLEPACGEGIFLRSAARRLACLGASKDETSVLLYGYELHEETVRAAYERLRADGVSAVIQPRDFFTVDPEGMFDVVVGNPPYIRYQDFTGEQRKIAQSRAIAQGVTINSLSSSWAPFVVHACGFLRNGGSLGMVLPAELMSSNYAGAVRAFLLSSFSNVDVVLFAHSVFPEVEEEVIVLLARGFNIGKSDGVNIRQEETIGREAGKGVFCRVSGDARWPLGEAGSRAAALLSEVDAMVPLGDWGRIRLGAVTGANSYFCLSEEDVLRFGLSASDVIRLCPAGSSHLRELTLNERKMMEVAQKGGKVNLFYPSEPISEAARAYIARGEALGIDSHYKCRSRNPWWRVPGIGRCDLFITYMNGVGPNLCVNELDLAFTNSVHGLTLDESLREVGRSVLPLVYLSTFSQLSAEVYGRSYGGGILKIEPREAARTLVLNPQAAEMMRRRTISIKDDSANKLARGGREKVRTTIDEMMLDIGVANRLQMEEAQSLLIDLRARREKRSSRKRGGR